MAEPVKGQNNATNQQKYSLRHPSVYMQASIMGSDAVHGCITKKRLEDCDKLNRIENTLTSWCGKGDRYACQTLIHIMKMRTIEHIGQI